MTINEKSDIDYKRIAYYIIIAVVLLAVLWLNYCSLKEHLSSNSQVINNFEVSENEMDKTRNPAVAGIFYASEPKQLDDEVEHYLAAEFRQSSAQPKILIVPHAGYQYSASVAAKAYLQLQKFSGKIKNVILVGPSHRVAFNGIAASSADDFKTPLGKVALNKEVVGAMVKNNTDVLYYDAAHAEEHCLEVQLPFLQKVLNKFKIVPLVYGNVSPDSLAKVLEPYLHDDNSVIIISADLSHYYEYNMAKNIDGKTADMIKDREPYLTEHMSCGATGINAALILAKEDHLHPDMLELANSGDTAGDKDRVVGYGAWAFGGSQKTEEPQLNLLEKELRSLESFSAYYGKELHEIAKKSLEEAVSHHRYSPSRSDYHDAVFNKGAAFVTLTKNGELRGCIGTVIPYQAVAHDIAANTYEAAMEDSRFAPITKEELPEIKISISLLTSFEEIKYKDEADLISQIQQGIDGLIIRDGNRQGLFLPSVWEQLPDRREFLNNLKLKAGMSPSYWSNNIKVYRFRTLEMK